MNKNISLIVAGLAVVCLAALAVVLVQTGHPWWAAAFVLMAISVKIPASE